MSRARGFAAFATGLAGLFAFVVPVVAAEPATDWQQTSSLPAPEAKQAAAADDRYVYVITNDKVARYDRRSGQKLDESVGAAQHLNSGFLDGLHLYCAHSNYPQQPEASQILALDLKSMRLSVFKDFGNWDAGKENSGGSLTWAVRRGDLWWCNFARYGADNARTLLVAFDSQWRERGRWTYPPEVLRRIGQMSLSGGAWCDDTLLVTDHDHPRLYRLRLPKQGSVLEFVDEQTAPITGQGISYDPATQELVGIDRAHRRVIFMQGPSATPVAPKTR